jgi:hypothetical protein
MKRFFYIFGFLAAISCASGGGQQDVDYTTFDRIPLQCEIKNVQPMTGIVLWNTHAKVSSAKDKIQLEYSYMLYNDVCKGKDVYD